MSIGLKPVGILGTGISLPEKVLTNKDLEKKVDTSDEWIRSRTGIVERRIVEEDVPTSVLAETAARNALEDAGVAAGDIDLIIVATITPDMVFPATACLVQDRLGAASAAAFDLEAGCTGFLYALVTAAQFISNGVYKNALVIGAETLSKLIDWEDRNTCVLFGDGAGAAVIGEVGDSFGILGMDLGSDGEGGKLLKVPGGGSLYPTSEKTIAEKMHYIQMEGNEVFKFAVRIMGESSLNSLEFAGMTKRDVDYLVPHQANIRIIQGALKRLELPKNNVYVNLDKYGNTSAASVPIALHEAVKDGEIKKGDNVVLVAFGAGLTWGSAVIRWGA